MDIRRDAAQRDRIYFNASADEMTALINQTPADIWKVVHNAIRKAHADGVLEDYYMRRAIRKFDPFSVFEMTLTGGELRIETSGYYALKISIGSTDTPALNTSESVTMRVRRADLKRVFEWAKTTTAPRLRTGMVSLQHVCISDGTMVATDRYRLLHITTPVLNIFDQAAKQNATLVRPDTVLKLLKTMSSDIVVWRETPNWIALEDGDTRYVLYKINRTFPDYAPVLDVKHNCCLTVDAAALEIAITSAPRDDANTPTRIVLTVGDKTLTVGESTCDLLSKEGDFQGSLALNRQYVMNFLKLAGAKATVDIHIKGAADPVRFALSNRPELALFIMPQVSK